MKAMVLAAGEGTRLRPLTYAVPKPMIPIVGVPLLARTVSWLASQGVTEIALNLYHRPQAIPDYFGDEWHGVRLHYFFEETLRGTAGGVKGAEEVLGDAPFFVIYGDNLISANLMPLADFHRNHGGEATVALFHHPDPTAAGIVGLDGVGRVTRFVEKPPPDQVFSDLANAGVYVLDPTVLSLIPEDRPSDFGKDVFPAMLAQGREIYGTLLGGYLQDTGTPEAYRQANWDVIKGRTGTTVESGIHPRAQIDPTAELIGRNIVGADAVIEAQTRLTDCIIWDGAVIGAGAHLERVILGNGARVAPGAHPPIGLVLGENEKFG